MSEGLKGLLKHPQIMDALLNLAATLDVLKGIHGPEKVERLYQEAVEEVRNEQRRRKIN